MTLNLFAHQEQFLQENKRKTMCIWETGTGKTITAIEWAKRARHLTPTTLVVCPKSLKKNWERNIAKYGGNYKFSIMSKEEFKRDWKKIERFENVVIDEAHFFANYKSQLSKAMLGYITFYKIENVLGLTATPYMSSPWNIYSLGLLMGKKWSWMYFNKTFFIKINMGGTYDVPVVRPDAQQLLLPLIEELGSTVRLKDCVDVPDDVLETEYFKQTYQQKQYIKTLFEPHHLTRWTKIHQSCGGVVKQTEYDIDPLITLASEKFDRVLELALEIDKPIIVCRYNGEVERIATHITAKGKLAYTITGQTKDKQAVLDLVHSKEKAVLIVNAACSEGWQLPSADTIIFYSYDFSLKNYIQMKGRIQRIDNIQKVKYISLIVEDTVDEDVHTAVVVRKMDFQLDIYKKDLT